MKPVLCFDLNGTLLDISALDEHFQSLFGDPGIRKEWFSEVLKIALATTVVNAYAEFGKISKAALIVIEQRYGRTLDETQRLEVLNKFRELPPFPDVEEGLHNLHVGGYTLAVLTNSSAQVAEEALKRARLNKYLGKLMSADSVQRLKPAAESYRMAAHELGVGLGSLMLVAAHSWDIAGAMWAGCQACFLRRPGQVLDEITPQPGLLISDLRDLPRQLQGRIQAVHS